MLGSWKFDLLYLQYSKSNFQLPKVYGLSAIRNVSFLQYLDANKNADALQAWSYATQIQPSHLNAWTNSIILLDNLGLFFLR